MRIAFATCASLPGGEADDQPTAKLLNAEFVVWNDPTVDWDRYDHVVVRSTWDYTRYRDEFVEWARSIGSRLSNPAELIAFNSDKAYLGVLDAPTVPTTFVVPGSTPPELTGEVVVKPTVSAGGRDTGRFDSDHHDEARKLIERIGASGRVAMIQPYLEGVDAEGETAAVYLGGDFAYALHKKPVLRGQGEPVLQDAGGDAAYAAIMDDEDLVTPGSISDLQRSLADDVMGQLTAKFGTPLYTRVDMVPGPNGPVVMEIEAVEPSLYMALVPGAAEKFAEAIQKVVR